MKGVAFGKKCYAQIWLWTVSGLRIWILKTVFVLSLFFKLPPVVWSVCFLFWGGTVSSLPSSTITSHLNQTDSSKREPWPSFSQLCRFPLTEHSSFSADCPLHLLYIHPVLYNKLFKLACCAEHFLGPDLYWNPYMTSVKHNKYKTHNLK